MYNNCGYMGATEDNLHYRLKKYRRNCILIVESPPPSICITAITELSPLTQLETIIVEDLAIEVEPAIIPVVDVNVVDEIGLFDEINTISTSIIDEILENELDKESTNGESLNEVDKRKGTTSLAVEEYKLQKKSDLPESPNYILMQCLMLKFLI
jgi:hypothetical protein